MTDEQCLKRIKLIVRAQRPGWQDKALKLLVEQLYESQDHFLVVHIRLLEERWLANEKAGGTA